MKNKIVHVTEAFAGGVLRCVVLLANLQAEAGHDVVIVHSFRRDTPPPEKLDAILDPRVNRRVVDFRTEIGLRDVLSLLKLLLILRRERADIIHLHSSKAGALGRVAALILFGIDRTIYSPHGFSFLKKDVSRRTARAYIWIERLLHAIGGTIIGCSRSEARYARMVLSRRRVGLVENAIDLDFFDFGEPSGIENRSVVVCTSGRVTYQKAPWKFSRLAADLSSKTNLRFVWFGDGDRTAVDAWIDQTVVDLSGWIDSDELRQRLKESDLFILPSLWEGMPLALIEAQAMGLPAVASRIAGNRDVIIHGVTGFLAHTDEELMRYTRCLIDDGDLRRRMGAAAREFAAARFGPSQFYHSFAQVSERLLGRILREDDRVPIEANVTARAE
ncbi:glycosyltransferase [Paraburkholderia madseniana]|uniref:glycosyltransferase n=1 Tax=Paraburkholderia madseniana TaxID=2599607 RepID=UPI0038B95AC8